MKHERIYLDPSDERVYIDTYVVNDRSHIRPAMLVIPGGGYSAVCTEREGEPIALAFLAQDFNCFVLNYRVSAKEKYPDQLIDASRAIIHIRENAEEYCIDQGRVYAVGFSAGGHLAGSLAILHKDPEVLSTLGIEKGANRPTACILGYPVVSALLSTHSGSFLSLSGNREGRMEDIPYDVKVKLSLETNVDSDSVPVFIWHTAEDELVPTAGSMALGQRYVECGIPVMLHLYPYGPHGLAVANGVTECGNPAWVQPFAEDWIKDASLWFKTLLK
ncbi:MAG: alpha/beta hydrolase [Clostridia bacterium]|nr:alpha/beta hydrolase [Clostridia bacterium]